MGIFHDIELAPSELFDPATLLGAVLYAVLFAVLASLAGRAVRLAVHRALERHSPLGDKTAITFLGQFARLGIYVMALVAYAYLIPVLRHLGAVSLASVGVVSVVFGLAAQNTLGNLIAGISLLLYRPFRLGDRLQVSGPTGVEAGVVESLSLGYTTICTDDNRRIVIPNSVMASQTSINVSLSPQRFMCVITLAISYKADIEKARNILIELAKQHAPAAQAVSSHVTAISDAGVSLTLSVHCPDPAAATALKSELLEAAKKRFDAEGIAFANSGS